MKDLRINRGKVNLPPTLTKAELDNSEDDLDDHDMNQAKLQTAFPSEVDPSFETRVEKYRRNVIVPEVKRDLKLKLNVEKKLKEVEDTAQLLAKTEWLLPEKAGTLEAEGLEKTYKFTQEQLKPNLSVSAAAKIFNLKLDKFGPYTLDYTRDGRQLLIAGRKGHVAMVDWRAGTSSCEFHLTETVRDVKFLHNHTMFAVAQKKYVYIYNNLGQEIHCLSKHLRVLNLEFLPYHFLLCSISDSGRLQYLDVSMGKMVSNIHTAMVKPTCLTQNIQNAVIHSGHACGTVALWSPNSKEPLVKVLAHLGPVRGVTVDHAGRYMATAGLDGKLKVWDLRNYNALYEYSTPRPAASISFSQRGILAVGFTGNISFWKDIYKEKQNSPYMNHSAQPDQVHDLQFCPYEDVLGFGHSGGFSSIVVPGAGEPNFDSLEVNLYATAKQRREREVHALLDKVQPDTITLDNHLFGGIFNPADFSEVKEGTGKAKVELRRLARGKSSSANHLRRDQGLLDLERKKERAMTLAERRAKRGRSINMLHPPRAPAIQPHSALDQFRTKPQFE